MLERFGLVFEKAKPFYENGDPGHDLAHIVRVIETCQRLGPAEGANQEILLPAACLHDIVNLPKNHPERAHASGMAAERSIIVLTDAGYTSEEINRIASVIAEHSFSRGSKPSSIESALLQDADRLDALGAVGIMRAVTCGCKLGASYYNGDDPFAANRALDDRAFTLDHFYTKLFKLPEQMNTESAKVEASKRLRFMTFFVEQLKNEIGLS